MSLQRHRLPPECVAYIQRCRYDAWLWLPPQDPAANPPPNWRPLWLPLHCAAARFARLRFVPRQPNPQRKEQHQENSHTPLPASFSPYSSLIKSTKPVSEMLARRDDSPRVGNCICNCRHISRRIPRDHRQFSSSKDGCTNGDDRGFARFIHRANLADSPFIRYSVGRGLGDGERVCILPGNGEPIRSNVWDGESEFQTSDGLTG